MNAIKYAAFLAATVLGMSQSFGDPVVKFEGIPAVPVGYLSAYPTVVQTGTKPTLTWEITHPKRVNNVVYINTSGSITVLNPIYMKVSIIGTHISTDKYTPAEARLKLNGGKFDQLFYGTQSEIDPARVLYAKKLKAGDVVNFGGRFVEDGVWSKFIATNNTTNQIVSLVTNDSIPRYEDKTAVSFIRPYVDGGDRAKIGPMSVLVMMEQKDSDMYLKSFDRQDMVLLVEFYSKQNNGHGNNLDGVDSSNPGKGVGGPNGSVDPSSGIDDEK